MFGWFNRKKGRLGAPKEPPPGAIAEAARGLQGPNGHVYMIDGPYGPNDDVPPEAIKGAWKVDENGKIVGEFIPNPNYRPKPIAP
jgi:hypothetical protein